LALVAARIGGSIKQQVELGQLKIFSLKQAMELNVK
jgi:hypothetical protein